MFSDKKVRFGACTPNLAFFYQKKTHPLRFCIGQYLSSEILQLFSEISYYPLTERGGVRSDHQIFELKPLKNG